MTCAYCLGEINRKREKYRDCPKCRTHYHRRLCFKMHKRTHKAGEAKYFNARRFWEA